MHIYMHNYTHDIYQYTWFNTKCFPLRKCFIICSTVVSSIFIFSWLPIFMDLSFSPWKLMFNEMQFLTKKCINRINTGHKFQYPWNWFFTTFMNINDTTWVHLQYSIKNAMKSLNRITCTCKEYVTFLIRNIYVIHSQDNLNSGPMERHLWTSLTMPLTALPAPLKENPKMLPSIWNWGRFWRRDTMQKICLGLKKR